MAALSDEQRVRYARHLLLPELGEAAQLKLLASRVRVVGDAGASEVAEEYLRRAGVRVLGDHDHDHAQVHVAEVRRNASLHEAAAAISGAFAAVEAIKALTGIGQPAQLDPDLLEEV